MPSRRKKYNARFPPSRIKKIMQVDEEVGKVAAAVPVLISRSLELFIDGLISESAKVTQKRNAKTITAVHMKQVITGLKQYDFLRDLVANISDTGGEDTPATVLPLRDGEGSGKGARGKGRGRKKQSQDQDGEAPEVGGDVKEGVAGTSGTTPTPHAVPYIPPGAAGPPQQLAGGEGGPAALPYPPAPPPPEWGNLPHMPYYPNMPPGQHPVYAGQPHMGMPPPPVSIAPGQVPMAVPQGPPPMSMTPGQPPMAMPPGQPPMAPGPPHMAMAPGPPPMSMAPGQVPMAHPHMPMAPGPPMAHQVPMSMAHGQPPMSMAVGPPPHVAPPGQALPPMSWAPQQVPGASPPHSVPSSAPPPSSYGPPAVSQSAPDVKQEDVKLSGL